MLRRRNGFTLIELLVVIAIIAILAAILFPVFARAKSSARLSGCQNNLKQLGVAMALYVDEYGRYPWAGANLSCPHDTRRKPLGLGGSKTCTDALLRYCKNEGVMWCPETPYAWRGAGNWSYWYYCPHLGTNPTGNTWVSGYNNGEGALCGFGPSDVRFAAKKPMLCEVSSRHMRFDGNNLYLYPIVYCDGHTKIVIVTSDRDPNLVRYLYVGRDGRYNGKYY